MQRVRLGLMLLIILLPLAHSNSWSNQFIPKTFVLLLFAFLFFLWRCSVEKIWEIRRLDISWYFLISLFSLSSTYALGVSSWYGVGYWTLLLIVYRWAQGLSLTELNFVFQGSLITATIVAFYGIVQSYFISPVNTYLAFVSTFGNVNFASAYLAILVPWYIHYAVNREQLWQQSIFVIGAIVSVYYIVIASTRAAWLALLLIIPLQVFFIVTKKSSRRILYGLIVLLIIVCLAVSMTTVGTHIYSQISEIVSSQGSVQVRAHIWQSSQSIVLQYPWLGVGLRQFHHYFYLERNPDEYTMSQGRMVSHPHNIFLDVGLSGGLFALFLFGIICYYTLRLLWKYHHPLRIPLSASFAIILLLGLFSLSIFSPAVGVIFAIVSGLASQYSSVLTSMRKRFIAVGLQALIILLLTMAVGLQVVGNHFFQTGQQFLLSKDFPKADHHLEQASLWQQEPVYYAEWARCLLAMKQYDKAIAAANFAKTYGPGIESSYITLAISFFYSGQMDKAKSTIADACQKFPASPIAHYNAGKMFLDSDPGKAIFFFERARFLNSEYMKKTEFHLQLGIAYERDLQFTKALISYSQAQEISPKDLRTNFYLGKAAFYLQIYPLAEENFLHAKAINDPQIQARSFFYLAQIYERKENWQQAVDYYDHVIQKDATIKVTMGRPLLKLALQYLQENKLQQAFHYTSRAIQSKDGKLLLILPEFRRLRAFIPKQDK